MSPPGSAIAPSEKVAGLREQLRPPPVDSEAQLPDHFRKYPFHDTPARFAGPHDSHIARIAAMQPFRFDPCSTGTGAVYHVEHRASENKSMKSNHWF